ncbi:MAG TPA: hypothetical protein PKZ53_26825, partial [Acidobacteriota bacterium]|nr:hypothetical protein [Acidobacteriota bacterium]
SNDPEFNPRVVDQITLPSGHTWNFKYNAYGEVTEVELPSHGFIRYTISETSPSTERLFRWVSKREVWTSNTQMEGKTVYVRDDYNQSPGSIVTERRLDAGNTLLSKVEHIFSDSPLNQYAVGFGVPGGTGYKPWRQGKELETVTYDSDGTTKLQTISYAWEQRDSVSWLSSPPPGRNNLSQPEQDPRMSSVETSLDDTGGAPQISRVTYQYDDDVSNGYNGNGFNNVTREQMFGYNGELLREIRRSYIGQLNGTNYQTDPNAHLRSLIHKESIWNANGEQETFSQYGYDEFDPQPITLTDSSRNQNRGINYKTRGNVTSVTVGGPNTVSSVSSMRYDVAGNVIYTEGPPTTGGRKLSIETTYDGALRFAYPRQTSTRVTEVDQTQQELTTSTDYDFSTGVVTSTR